MTGVCPYFRHLCCGHRAPTGPVAPLKERTCSRRHTDLLSETSRERNQLRSFWSPFCYWLVALVYTLSLTLALFCFYFQKCPWSLHSSYIRSWFWTFFSNQWGPVSLSFFYGSRYFAECFKREDRRRASEQLPKKITMLWCFITVGTCFQVHPWIEPKFHFYLLQILYSYILHILTLQYPVSIITPTDFKQLILRKELFSSSCSSDVNRGL